MAILNEVKQALGIYYSEETKDAEVNRMISAAKSFLTGAGWPSTDLQQDEESALAKDAIIIYCKMAINTDPVEMRINPVLVAMIAQARVTPAESEAEEG